MNHEEVLERLSEVVEGAIGRKPYDKEIAKEIGMSPAHYSNMKKKKKLPLENIANYCALKRVSISWLLYEQSSQMLADSSGDVLKIPYLDQINGSAGGGAFNENEDFTYLSLDSTYVKLLGIGSGDQIEAINLTGESMEPTLKEGSIVLIDKKKDQVTNGGIFALNVGGHLFIKRVSLNTSGGLDLISDNSIIPIEKVSLEDVFVAGKVIGALERI